MKEYIYFFLTLLLVIVFPGCREKELTGIQTYFAWTPDRTPMVSAHRGGPYPGYPENCIETFEYVLNHTDALIECDIALSRDGVLLMMHDQTLDRTTNGSGQVSEQAWEQMKNLNLKDPEGNITAFHIPTLEDVLQWASGKCILTLDVKQGVPFEMVVDLVEKHNAVDYSVIITYTLDQARMVYKLNTSLMLSVGIYTPDDLKRYKSSEIPLGNLIAFTGTAEKEQDLYDLLHENGIYCILGTLGNLDKRAEARGDHIYPGFIEKGADILATDRPIEAAIAIGR